MDLTIELADIRTGNILRDMSDREKALMVEKLLGPLTDSTLLTHREAGFFFCHVARGASHSVIGRDFGISKARARQILDRAEEKIKERRDGNVKKARLLH